MLSYETFNYSVDIEVKTSFKMNLLKFYRGVFGILSKIYQAFFQALLYNQ